MRSPYFHAVSGLSRYLVVGVNNGSDRLLVTTAAPHNLADSAPATIALANTVNESLAPTYDVTGAAYQVIDSHTFQVDISFDEVLISGQWAPE